MAAKFEEDFEVDEDDLRDEEKGSQFISIANGTPSRIIVRIEPIRMVQQEEEREKEVALGAGIDGQVGVKFKLGKGHLTTWEKEAEEMSVARHSLHDVPIPSDSLPIWKKGKAARVENSVKLRIFTEIEGGDREKFPEVGAGYLLGPGHGLVVSSDEIGRCEVEQTRDRTFFKKFNPWLSRMGVNRDPHDELHKRGKCPICGFKK
eukprot:GFUD01034029.1.p1 GENE.GFUD01034029.1~~GFUD01034029.1.p1  ORF type:complete len:205 (+),score=42.79 GFUD01034029.1:333-947(+)